MQGNIELSPTGKDVTNKENAFWNRKKKKSGKQIQFKYSLHWVNNIVDINFLDLIDC